MKMKLSSDTNSLLCLLFIFSAVILQITTASRFGYTKSDQRRWQRKHTACAGKFQSPISIFSSKAISLHMPAIELVGYHNLLPGPIQLHNNGHSVALNKGHLSRVDEDAGVKLPYIFGGKLQNEYEFEGLHFHWGDKNNRGSEHVLNDIRYPMEVHLIHRNRKYKSVNEALTKSDGLTVLGFFYQISEFDSDNLGTMVKHLPMIEDYNKDVELNTTFSLASLLHGVELERFYTYKGSLTTPPCAEAVTWVIYPEPLSISNYQMSRFRLLSNGLEGSIIVDNYRDVQPIGARRVFIRKVNEKHTKLSALNGMHFSKWDWSY